MQAATIGSDEYLDAFMNGFEFVLLAIRGRLNEGKLPRSERERLEAFLADYARIVQAYQERRRVVPTATLDLSQAFRAELESFSAN
jgi:hypothetical protein